MQSCKFFDYSVKWEQDRSSLTNNDIRQTYAVDKDIFLSATTSHT
jgi:hypothetical protein